MSTETGPRPAVRSADRVAQLLWTVLVDVLRTLKVFPSRSVLSAPHEERANCWVEALYALTDEDPASIRSRAEAEAARVATESKEG